jgi:hypothetical protein
MLSGEWTRNAIVRSGELDFDFSSGISASTSEREAEDGGELIAVLPYSPREGRDSSSKDAAGMRGA